jgi:hypothetical protein
MLSQRYDKAAEGKQGLDMIFLLKPNMGHITTSSQVQWLTQT